MSYRSFISIKDISQKELMQLLQRAKDFSKEPNKVPIFLQKNKYVVNIFLEDSTRTKYSFDMAQKKLGLQQFDFTANYSSISKGESLLDTLKTFEAIGTDCAVIRLKEEGVLGELSKNLNMSIINAGEGSLEHPTQCLLDLLTIEQSFSSFTGLKILIVGDVKHSRVVGSHLKILKSLGFDLKLCGPDHFIDSNCEFESVQLDEYLPKVDIVMGLRVQNERHNEELIISNDEYHQKYGLNLQRINKMKENSIVMHPGPFNLGVEITQDVVDHEKSKIWQQKTNGVFIRMALLEFLLKEGNI